MSKLNLLEAENKKRWQLLIGWSLLILGTTLYIAACLKGGYSFLSHPSDGLSAIFLRPFANLIALLYWTIPGMRLLWSITPSCNLAVGNWLDPSNLPFGSFLAFSLGLMLVGSQLRWSAKNLSRRVASAHLKAQEDQWQSEISGRQLSSSAAIAIEPLEINLDSIQINYSSEDRWWSRPLGIVGLGIILGVPVVVIGEAINVWLGLSH